MESYRSILKEASAEQIIERSRFIAYAAPAESREEAEAFFARIRTKHRDATHNVPAMVIGARGELLWASDDGEPQGTSGPPILQLMVKEEICNAAIIVTRYFGGIKLGTGGLTRAYSSSAKLVLAEAGLCRVTEEAVSRVQLDYSLYGKLQNLAESGDFRLRAPVYGEKITLDLGCAPDYLPRLKAIIADLSSGSCALTPLASEMVRIPE